MRILPKLDRRQLVASGATGLLGAGLLQRSAPAWALEPPAATQFYVFVQTYGAWDVCLAFDPKDRDALMPNGERQTDQPYAFSEVLETSGIKLPPQGMALAPFADRMAIINGIDMGVDNGHVPDAMMSGTVDPRSINRPFMQAALARRHPFTRATLIPHLYASYDGEFFAGSYGAESVTAEAADALRFLSPDDSVGFDAVVHFAQEFAARQTGSGRRVASFYTDAAAKAAEVGGRLSDGTFVVPDELESPEGLGLFVGQLFQRRILGSVTWSMGDRHNFDTHADHYALHPLTAALGEVERLCNALKAIPFDAESSVFDKTTVVLTAEYARTARLNAFNGKDHNFRTNSMALIGAGVRPGVYGASGVASLAGRGYEPHVALPIDLATGRPSDTGVILRAENIWAGLGSVFGVDLSPELGAAVRPIGFQG